VPIREIGVLAVALAACVTDLRSHRIPNLLTVSGAAAALVFHVVSSGWTGVGVALGGWLVGLVVFLP
jgi:prepilin peptidase CpaA